MTETKDRAPIDYTGTKEDGIRQPGPGGSDNVSNTKFYVIGAALAVIAVTAFIAFH